MTFLTVSLISVMSVWVAVERCTTRRSAYSLTLTQRLGADAAARGRHPLDQAAGAAGGALEDGADLAEAGASYGSISPPSIAISRWVRASASSS